MWDVLIKMEQEREIERGDKRGGGEIEGEIYRKGWQGDICG